MLKIATPLDDHRNRVMFDLFYRIFDVVHAVTPEQKEQAHRIRYNVFCLENEGYENPEQHPDGLEKDEYDERAEHALLIYKPKQLAIGTVRVIAHNKDNWQESFPLQKLCKSIFLKDETLVKNAGEISRFCISDELRKIIKGNLKNETAEIEALKGIIDTEDHMHLNTVLAMASLGLIRGAYELLMHHGCLNYFAVMEPHHMKGCLDKRGVVYEQIGPEMEYHGTRTPFFGNLLETYENIAVEKHDIWKIMTMNGDSHNRALDLYYNQQGQAA